MYSKVILRQIEVFWIIISGIRREILLPLTSQRYFLFGSRLWFLVIWGQCANLALSTHLLLITRVHSHMLSLCMDVVLHSTEAHFAFCVLSSGNIFNNIFKDVLSAVFLKWKQFIIADIFFSKIFFVFMGYIG